MLGSIINGQRGGSIIDGSRGVLFGDFGRSLLFFMPRVGAPAEVTPAADAGWQNVAAYYASAELKSQRDAADTLGLLDAVNGGVIVAGQSTIDRQFVSKGMPAGIDFTGSRAWGMFMVGLATGTNVRARSALRVVSSDGTIVRATLAAVGTNGQGTATTPNTTRTFFNNFALAAYTTQDGDRLVLEVGFIADTNGTGEAVYGSTPIAGFMTLHAMGIEGGNPGSRAPYFEITGATWPS